VSQIHSFWFVESERSCLQALECDPKMAMAYWCIALSAASDYRPAFQLPRNRSNAARPDVASGEASATGVGSGEATVRRQTSGAALDPQIRAREATAKAMELRDNVTERERFYIEAQFRAHHYLSHAYEGSKTPDKAWHSNARYAGLVFNIPHALHMPGHIYAQSDRIEGAISAFSAGRGCGA